MSEADGHKWESRCSWAVAVCLIVVPLFACSWDYFRSDRPGQGGAPIAVPVPDSRLHHENCFVVFPQDCNSNPPMLFGGKLFSEMDRTAAVTVRRLLYGSKTAKDAVTVAVDDFKFNHAAEVKDLVVVTGDVVAVGEKSITVLVRAHKEFREGKMQGMLQLAEGRFTFVAYDAAAKKGVPHGLPPLN